MAQRRETDVTIFLESVTAHVSAPCSFDRQRAIELMLTVAMDESVSDF
jgi:hypothetical protein